MKSKWYVASVPGLMVLLATCARPPRTDVAAGAPRRDAAIAASLGSQFDSLRLAARIPGLAVAILRDTTLLLARGYGLADVERQQPVLPTTPFDIASVSKPISAVVALRLVQDGLLDLDTPMRRFRDFPPFCEATRAQGGIFFGDFACVDDRLTLRHVLSMTANGEPGTRFWYNPPVYSWASRPMAEVAGRPFSLLVDSLVFRPAMMAHAARKHRGLPLPAEVALRLALPYGVDSAGRRGVASPPPPQGDGAAGGVVASVLDLARFDVALTTGRLLHAGTHEQMFRAPVSATGQTIPYGLGWFLGDIDGRRVAWHTGLWEGRYSALYLKVLGVAPADRLTLILLANSDGLQWSTRLDEAEIGRSPYARSFLAAFPASPPE